MSKVKAKFTRSTEEKHIGGAPANGQKIDHILPVLNHYNYFYTLRDAYDFLLEYLKTENKEQYKAISKLSHNDISSTSGWIACMLSMECVLPVNAMIYFKKEIARYMVKAESKIEKLKDDVVLVSTKDSPATILLSSIEDEVDKFFNNPEASFDPASFLKINNASTASLRTVADFYRPKLEELQQIKTDPQVKEAYTFMTPAQIKKAMAFYQKIISAASQNAENKRRERKPRMKKAKSVDAMVKSISLKQNDPETNISSLPAEKIVGSSVLILYNTKTQTVTIYEGEKITVKGKTLENVNKAFTKKLRKPKEQLPLFSKTTKRSYMKTFEALTTKSSTPSNRINDDQILVYVSA